MDIIVSRLVVAEINASRHFQRSLFTVILFMELRPRLPVDSEVNRTLSTRTAKVWLSCELCDARRRINKVFDQESRSHNLLRFSADELC